MKKIIITALLLLMCFTFFGHEPASSQERQNSILKQSSITAPPLVNALPGKSLKKSNGTNSYNVDYWPILWSWYLDVAPHGEQALLYYRNPKAVNGGWEIEIMYEFQVATDSSFNTLVYTNRMIEDRYAYRKWPSHAKKWMDTIGVARPNPDTTYWVMRDSSWVNYGTTYYSRVNMRWFDFDPVWWYWADYYDSTNRMYVNETPGGPWSNTMAFTMNKPLPVELVEFYAVQEGSQIKLRWKTYSETMCYAFIIKRQNEVGLWESLGSVPGSGTTSYVKRYSFIDATPLLYQTNVYQLTQLNNQGVTEDLWTTSCNMITSLSHSYPNPADEKVIIPFVLIKDGLVTIRIYDIRGIIMDAPIIDVQYSSGNYYVEVNTQRYPSGIYLYDLTIGNIRSVKKLLVIH